jgi:hypothetical protein
MLSSTDQYITINILRFSFPTFVNCCIALHALNFIAIKISGMYIDWPTEVCTDALMIFLKIDSQCQNSVASDGIHFVQSYTKNCSINIQNINRHICIHADRQIGTHVVAMYLSVKGSQTNTAPESKSTARLLLVRTD